MSNITLYSEAQAALEEFRSRFVGRVYDVTTTDGMKDAKAARREVREARTSLEKKRQELKAPLLEKERALDGQAKQLTAALLEIEQPIDELIKDEEARVARAKAEEARKERLRVEAIQERIRALEVTIPFGADRKYVEDRLRWLAGIDPGEGFGEFAEDAAAAKARATDMLIGALEKIAEAEREDAERREQARVYGIKARIDSLNRPIPFDVTAEQLTDLRARLEAVEITEADFGEFCDDAAAARRAGLEAVSGAWDVLAARQAQDEEAARLREAEEARKAEADKAAAAAEDAESLLKAWDDSIAEAEADDPALAEQDGHVRFTEAPAPANSVRFMLAMDEKIPAGHLTPDAALAIVAGTWPTVIGWLHDMIISDHAVANVLEPAPNIPPCEPEYSICYCELRDAVEVIEAALAGRYTDWYGGGARGTCLNPVKRPLDDSEAGK